VRRTVVPGLGRLVTTAVSVAAGTVGLGLGAAEAAAVDPTTIAVTVGIAVGGVVGGAVVGAVVSVVVDAVEGVVGGGVTGPVVGGAADDPGARGSDPASATRRPATADGLGTQTGMSTISDGLDRYTYPP
jgi:hypothetical protein